MNWLFAKEPEIPDEVMLEVEKAHRHTYLFGSRKMANFFGFANRVNEETDWDFAFPYEGHEMTEVEHMTSLGWAEKPTEKYKDDMHFITWEKVIGTHKVQMCSKINLSLFKRTFDSLDPKFYWTYLHKSSPFVFPREIQTEIFNQLYQTKGY